MVNANEFRPFEDDASSVQAAGLTFENGPDAVAVYGNATFTRDKRGLAGVRSVLQHLKAVESALEAADLPEAVAEDDAPETVKNPFG